MFNQRLGGGETWEVLRGKSYNNLKGLLYWSRKPRQVCTATNENVESQDT